MAKAGYFVSRWKGAARAAGKWAAAAIARLAGLWADRPLEGRGAIPSDVSLASSGHGDARHPILPAGYAVSAMNRATSCGES